MTAVPALLSSLSWGTSDFMGGSLSRRIRPIVVVAVAHTVAASTLIVVAIATGSLGAPLGYLPWAVGSAVVGLVALVAFYRALSTGRMGIVAPIAGTGVVVPVVFGILAGDSPSGWQVGGIAAAVAGVVLAGGPELSRRAGSTGRQPLVLALVAALGFGVVFVFIDRAASHSILMTLLTMRLTSVLILALLGIGYVVRRRRAGLPVDSAALTRGLRLRYLPVIAVVGWTDVGANGLYAVATRHGLLSVTAVLSSLYPAVTVLLARFVAGERLRRVQDLGIGLAMCGVVMLAAG